VEHNFASRLSDVYYGAILISPYTPLLNERFTLPLRFLVKIVYTMFPPVISAMKQSAGEVNRTLEDEEMY
jgi:hypothetical protein